MAGKELSARLSTVVWGRGAVSMIWALLPRVHTVSVLLASVESVPGPGPPEDTKFCHHGIPEVSKRNSEQISVLRGSETQSCSLLVVWKMEVFGKLGELEKRCSRDWGGGASDLQTVGTSVLILCPSLRCQFPSACLLCELSIYTVSVNPELECRELTVML